MNKKEIYDYVMDYNEKISLAEVMIQIGVQEERECIENIQEVLRYKMEGIGIIILPSNN